MTISGTQSRGKKFVFQQVNLGLNSSCFFVHLENGFVESSILENAIGLEWFLEKVCKANNIRLIKSRKTSSEIVENGLVLISGVKSPVCARSRIFLFFHSSRARARWSFNYEENQHFPLTGRRPQREDAVETIPSLLGQVALERRKNFAKAENSDPWSYLTDPVVVEELSDTEATQGAVTRNGNPEPHHPLRRTQTAQSSSTKLLFSVLLLLGWRTARCCPLNCKYCATGLAECEQVATLQQVLTSIPSSTEKILLRHGNMSEIPSASFQNFSELHLLSMTGFLLYSLPNGTFATSGTSKLRSLDLSHNQLQSCGIGAAAFSGLGALEELILMGNFLDSLKKSWFLDTSPLRKLLLSKNRLSYLPPRIFERLAQLEELSVSSNLIRYLSTDTFYGLTSLSKVDLSSNEILFIDHDVFSPLRALKELLLLRNKLVTLPSLPESVSALSLQENPWSCECGSVTAFQLLGEKVQDPRSILCHSPERLRGRLVLSVGPEVCITMTPAAHLPLPPHSTHLSVLYGFAGGLSFPLLASLIFYCIWKPWKQSRATNPEGCGTDWHKDSWKGCSSPRSASPLPHPRTRTAEKRQITDSLGPTCFNSPTCTPAPGGRPSGWGEEKRKVMGHLHLGSMISSVAGEGALGANVMSRSVSAPGSLSTREEKLLKRDSRDHSTLVSQERPDWTKDTDPGVPGSVKYFETHQEETAVKPKTQACVTQTALASSISSASQMGDPIMAHTALNRRRRTWSSFHCDAFNHTQVPQSSETETAGKDAQDHSNREAALLPSAEACLEKGEHPATSLEDYKGGKAGEDVGMQHDPSDTHDGFHPPASQKHGNSLSTKSSKAVFTHGPIHPEDLTEMCPAVGAKDLEFSPLKEHSRAPPLCEANTQKAQPEFFLSSDKLAKERFWKYHTKCCDDYQPCPTAKKALKQLKEVALSLSQPFPKGTAPAPPSDTDLLKGNARVTANLFVQLAQRRKTHRMDPPPWK
ncbi:uncharacterized protein LOC119927119 [Tachyglossus aculeatus]|uniref:uncharacterized protein LOC119927119 n=1 Tax=Tachyglossus aculeatus TaxID=9261 RepID=UPI0018F598CD|nr:uncharacterized protein LOC119927119 [Tachyglossus aculeatus]